MKKVGHAVLRNFLPIRRNFAPQTFLNSTMNVFTIMLESEGKNLLLLMLQRLLKTDTTCWIVGWVSTCSLEEPFQSQLEASGFPSYISACCQRSFFPQIPQQLIPPSRVLIRQEPSPRGQKHCHRASSTWSQKVT